MEPEVMEWVSIPSKDFKSADESCGVINVRTRSILLGNGSIISQLFLFCPKVLSTVIFDNCCFCDNFIGTSSNNQRKIEGARCRLKEPSTNLSHLKKYFHADKVPLEQIMSRNVVCVTQDVNIESIMALMLQHGYSGFPVVDNNGQPFGIISKTDIIREHYENYFSTYSTLSSYTNKHQWNEFSEIGLYETELASITVGDIMTQLYVFLPETTHIARAAALMSYEKIHRLPILSDGSIDGVIGIVTMTDIARWFAFSNGYVIPWNEQSIVG